MDHRLREIEQWVAEARKDLGENGQDAYLEKLFLLDAEIRAVIRENGSLPAASSPGQAGGSVRRQSMLALSLGTTAFLAILAVATVFTLPGGGLLARQDGADTMRAARSGVPLGSRIVLAGSPATRSSWDSGAAAGLWDMSGSPAAALPSAEPVKESYLDVPASTQPIMLAGLTNQPPAGQTSRPASINTDIPRPAEQQALGVILAADETRNDASGPVEVLPAALLTADPPEGLADDTVEKRMKKAELTENLRSSLGKSSLGS